MVLETEFTRVIGSFVIQSDSLCCLVLDKSGVIQFTNQAFEQLINHKEETTVGKSLYDILIPSEAEEAQTILTSLFDTSEQIQQQLYVTNQEGKVKYIESEARLIEVLDEEYVLAVLKDNTEVKELEHSLRKKNDELEALNNRSNLFISTARIGTWTLDLHTGLNYWNDILLDMYGLDRDQLHENQDIWRSFVHPEDAEHLFSELSKVWEGHTIYDVDFRIRRNGEIRYLRASSSPIFNSKGQIVKLTGANIDVTKEKLDEIEKEKQRLELAKRNDQLKLSINTAKLGIWRLDIESGKFDTNDQILDLYQLNNEQEIALSDFRSKVHPDDVAASDIEVMRALNGEFVENIQFRLLHSDGTVKHILGSVAPFKNERGEVYEVHGVNIDVTDLVEASQHAIDKHNQLDNITNHVDGVVLRYVFHPDETEEISFISEAVEHVFGINKKDVLADNSTFWACFHPDDVDELRTDLLEATQKVAPLESYFRIITTDGEIKHIRAKGMPFKNEQDAVVWDTTFFDITNEIKQRSLIKDSKEQLTNFTDQIPGIVLRYRLNTDQTEDLLYLTKGVEKIFGLNRDEVINDVSMMWDCVIEEDLTTFREAIIESAAELNHVDQYYRIKNAHGELKYLHCEANPKRLDDGSTIWDAVILDITKQRISEQAAKEKQDQLDSLTNQVPGIVYRYRLNTDGTDEFVFISRGLQEIFGVSIEEAMQDTTSVWGVIHEDDIEAMNASIAASTLELKEWTNVFRIITRSGEVKHIQGSGVPNKLDDGTIEWDSICMDITEQIEQQEILKTKQNQLKSVTNNIQGVVLKYQILPDGSDRVTYISEGSKPFMGVDAHLIMEDTTYSWNQVHKDDFENARDSLIESANNLSKWSEIVRFNTPDGIRYLDGNGIPSAIEDGIIEFDIVFLDVTSRIEAENEALTSDKKLRSFIDTSPMAIYQLNKDGIVTDFWNDAAEETFGWSKEEVTGRFIPHVAEEHRDEFVEIMEHIKTTRKPHQFKVKRNNSDHNQIVLDITAGPLFNSEGELTDLLIIANDVTQLEKYQVSIEEALKEKEVLLMEIHHRVKNNLAIVSGLIDLQIMQLSDERDTSVLVDARNRIQSISIVHEQLYKQMQYSKVGLNDYYKELFENLQRNMLMDGADITYDLRFDIDFLNINRAVPLGLLITEIFINSLKYAINDNTCSIKLHVVQEGEGIRVIYADNGPGFDKTILDSKKTLGWELINTLLLQLEAEAEFYTEDQFKLSFYFEETDRGAHSNIKDHLL